MCKCLLNVVPAQGWFLPNSQICVLSLSTNTMLYMARIQCLERSDTLIWYHWKRTVILSTICSFDGEVSSHHRLVKYIKSCWHSWSKWFFCVSWRSRPRNPVIHSREGFLRQVFRIDLSNALEYHLTAFPLCTTVRTKCRVSDWPPNGGKMAGDVQNLSVCRFEWKTCCNARNSLSIFFKYTFAMAQVHFYEQQISAEKQFLFIHIQSYRQMPLFFVYIYLQTLELYTHNQSRSKHVCRVFV